MRKIFFILFIFSFSIVLFSAPADKIKFKKEELTPIELQFFTKISEGNRHIETYYDGFLIASGITNENDFNTYKWKLESLRASAKKDLSQYVSEGDSAFADRLLRWLYSSGYLSKYSLRATLAQQLLDTGEYNCLSSSIIYSLLYSEFGFMSKGVLTKDHSFITIITEGGDIDVETTIAIGFNPGRKEIEEMANSMRITYVPKNNYRDRTDVPVATLIASLYANSISLVRTTTPSMTEALTMYKKGYYLAPNFDFFSNNIIASLNNLGIDNTKKGNYETAQRYFQEAENFNPNNPITLQNRIFYYNTIGLIYLNNKDFPSAIQVFKEGVINIGDNNSSGLKQNLKVAYYNYAVNEYNAKRYNNANTIASEALVLFPQDRDFLKLKSTMP